MPNLFAYVALIAWPFIAYGLFKKCQVITATFWTIVGGYLLLPVKVAIDFPLIPPLDKQSIAAISALLGCLFIKRIKIPLIPKSGLERWLTIALLIIPIITVMNNQEPIYTATGFKPGLTPHDALSAIVQQYIMLIPFFLGLHLVKTYDDQIKIFKLLVIAGLWYSLLILFEIRMSPQLHTWIYGFFPHSFGQQIRFDGFRSVVFLGHGLLTAMFVAITLGAATILWKEQVKVFKLSPSLVIIYLLIVLFLSKTISGFILGVFLLFSIGWLSAPIINKAALLIIIIVILYPLLCIFELFPHQHLLALISDFDVNRAQSLGYRFYHEARLLEHAQDKFFFGWGGWGRNRLSNSVTDGHWIITFGQSGFVGFISLYSLAVLSVFRAIRISKFFNKSYERKLILSHALIISIIMVDQLPNASLATWLWFLIGALMGRASSILIEHRLKISWFNKY